MDEWYASLEVGLDRHSPERHTGQTGARRQLLPKETLHERHSPARERSRRFGMDRFALVMYAP
jgi:hypothetical protein